MAKMLILKMKTTKPTTSHKNSDKPRCITCGRFMRRIGLIARIRLEAECGIIRTHMCVKEEITYATGERVHH